ncbi:response regulator [Fredinandcohnia sp. 179-A 10B2 NHS]|uniref:response regulator transcription factor n=1 Tax=Fredinandcohnia sp. 179-A 10B2 NHS TaxID=3235176 RepID=UPI00399F5061
MYKLMITEDEPLVRAGLKQYFDWESLGVCAIVEAENGKEGMEVALRERPDLVITDIRMPEMDGLEMIEKLREELPDTVFIVLTGYSEFSYAQKAIRYGGVHDYLVKPLEYEESLTAVTNCIKKLEQRKLDANQTKNESSIPVDTTDLNDFQLFNKIETFIRENIDQELTLNTVAEHFFYNPSYLSRLFKTKLNKNYMTFVSEIRVQFAKECLSQSRYSVTDVSKLCGYKSYKHFVKIFKSVSQLTPTEYRKKIRM